MMNRRMALMAFTLASSAFAQPAPTTFPADSAPLAPAALQETLGGKTYVIKLADGSTTRWQFNTNGYFYCNAGNFSDSGKWSVKESALCTEGKKIKASCNEIQQQGTDLFLKRDNGEVVTLMPQ